jgi:signal transduction histidine kinase
VLIAAACLLPLLGVTSFALVQGATNGRDQLLEAQGKTAEAVAQMLAANLAENQQVLAELAASDRVRKLDPTTADETLDQFKRARPNLLGLFMVNPEGATVSKSGLDPALLRAEPGFDLIIDRALDLGEPGVSGKLTIPDAEVIALTAPVHAKDQESGAPIAAVGSLLSVDRLRDTVLPFARGDTIIAIVGDGEVIASQGGGDDAALAEQLAEPMSLALSGSIGSGDYGGPDGEFLAAYAPVPGAAWAVMVTHPAPAAYAPNRMLLERGMLAIVLAALATLALVLLLGESIARPLRQLTGQAAAIEAGDLSPKPVPSGGGEIATLGAAFRGMADRLAAQLHDLEVAREAGAAHAAQLRDLNRRTVRLQEDERRRIAGDIHDAVAPLITGALYQARALQLANGHAAGHAAGYSADDAHAAADHGPNGHGNGNGRGYGANGHGPDGDADPVAEGLAAIGDLLGRATDELHNVIFALRPPDLDDLGIVPALERYVAGVRRAGLECDLEVSGETPALTPEVRLAIYRIVQESLHNALRHGGADRAVVRIETGDHLLRVSISDNGAGFNPDIAARPTSLGLLSMRERAAAIGATFAIASRPGDGTTIVIERPMDPDTERAGELPGPTSAPVAGRDPVAAPAAARVPLGASDSDSGPGSAPVPAPALAAEGAPA